MLAFPWDPFRPVPIWTHLLLSQNRALILSVPLPGPQLILPGIYLSDSPAGC